MDNTTLICKAVVSTAISLATAVAVYKTGDPVCLWALFFAVIFW